MENDLTQLHDAIARNIGAVLSLPSAGMLRHRKTRFLAANEDSLWVETQPEDVPHLNELISMNTAVGVAFKAGPLKTVFATPVLERVDDYKVNSTTVVFAARLAMPASIKAMQRRSNYRVPIPKDAGYSLNVWRIAPRVPLRDKPAASTKINVELIDISMGGLGVFFLGANGQPPRICQEDRLRVHLIGTDMDLLVEGSMRHPVPTADPAKLKAGIAFKTLENDLEGRQILAKLAKITGDFQRMEVRRNRLGMAG